MFSFWVPVAVFVPWFVVMFPPLIVRRSPAAVAVPDSGFGLHSGLRDDAHGDPDHAMRVASARGLLGAERGTLVGLTLRGLASEPP